jgi:cysteine-S-conjugate beta-lyase
MSTSAPQTSHRTTHLIHHPYEPPGGFGAPLPPVHKASTVFFPSVAAMRARDWRVKAGYTYGLHGTPTTFTLESRIATLEGAHHALLVPSGLCAIANVSLALLKAGDEVLIPSNAYGPNKALAEGELAQWGISHALYDPMNPADLAARITPRTALVWLEVPGSVTMEFADLPALVRVCRAANDGAGVRCALDNTWGAGLAFAPFDLDGAGLAVDVSIHALTKYPSGGGDVLMGSVCTQDDALHERLLLAHMRLGLGVSANDCETVLRSLPSMALRYDAHDAAARQLAVWCGQQRAVAQVLHPALPSGVGHAHWRQLCGSGRQAQGRAAGLFSVILQPQLGRDRVDAFCDHLRLFKLGYSWGGPISLVVPYDLSAMRPQWPQGITPGHLVRFSVGLEDPADLIADLQQAMAAAQRQ